MDIYNINVIPASAFYPVTFLPGFERSQVFAESISNAGCLPLNVGH